MSRPTPALSGKRLLREIREMGYAGGHTWLTDFLRGVRPPRRPVFERRFETPLGRQAQVGFAQFRVEFTDEPGVTRILWLFTMVLGHSRWLWGRFCTTQDLQTGLRRHIEVFAAMAGAPGERLYERMKTAVIGEDAEGLVSYNASLVALLTPPFRTVQCSPSNGGSATKAGLDRRQSLQRAGRHPEARGRGPEPPHRVAGLRGRPPVAPPEERAWEERVMVDEARVFRFSAVTFNAHRIHYDLQRLQAGFRPRRRQTDHGDRPHRPAVARPRPGDRPRRAARGARGAPRTRLPPRGRPFPRATRSRRSSLPWFARRRVADFAAAFDAEGVTWSQFRSFGEAVREDGDLSPENPVFAVIDQPAIDSFPIPGTPFHFGAVARQPPRPAPRLGQQTEEILADALGLGAAEIGRLMDARVVAGPGPG